MESLTISFYVGSCTTQYEHQRVMF